MFKTIVVAWSFLVVVIAIAMKPGTQPKSPADPQAPATAASAASTSPKAGEATSQLCRKSIIEKLKAWDRQAGGSISQGQLKALHEELKACS